MPTSQHILLALISATTIFADAAQLEPRAVNCGVVTGALAILKPLGAPATSLCSSYLKIPATTTTATTTTPATVTVYTTTVTNTVTSAVCPAARAKRGLQAAHAAEAKRNAMVDEAAEQNIEKRAVNIPALSIFAAAQLSSACSCLNIKPKATITNTIAAPAPIFNTGTTTTTCTTLAPPPPPSCLGNPCDFVTNPCCAGLACTAPRVDLPDRCCRFSGDSCVNNDECCTANCREERNFGKVCQ